MYGNHCNLLCWIPRHVCINVIQIMVPIYMARKLDSGMRKLASLACVYGVRTIFSAASTIGMKLIMDNNIKQTDA